MGFRDAWRATADTREYTIDPASAGFPTLASCDALVEFHDFIRPEVSQRTVKRLETTHHFSIIEALPRTDLLASEVAPFLSIEDVRFACDEFCPPRMTWGWFRRKEPLP